MFVPRLEYVLLFVQDSAKSADFYGKLFDLKPVHDSPTFVLFVLPGGVKFGLWGLASADPRVTASPGASEICFPADDVDALHQEWKDLGVSIVQEPTEMDFGRTFVALDPDGHRIRIHKLKDM